MYTEACQIVVKADSSINTVEDLQDKRVSVGEEESGTEQNAKQILAAYGLNDSLVDEVNLDYSNAAEELREVRLMPFSVPPEHRQQLLENLQRNVIFVF